MACPAHSELSAWSAGALPKEAEARIAGHVVGCDACRGFVASELEQAGADAPTESAAVTAAERRAPKRPAPPPVGKGTLVGRYVVVSELGKGGMGAVYAAYDPQLDRKVAVKLLHLSRSALPASEAAARLQREAQALARVSHPNTVAVYDVGTHDGRVFIAMEHVEGQTLRSWLKAERRGWREAVRVLRDAGEGLVAVHAAGLVHRDFKPGNVIVTADAHVKVLDFGLARLSASDGARAARSGPMTVAEAEAFAGSVSLETPLTEEGSLSGTPGYMAPELLAGEVATEASDQFALGVTLYLALYGARPFAGASFEEFRTSLKAGLPPSPPTAQGVPRWLYPIVRKSLAFRAQDRFPSVRALLDALGRDPALARRRWALRVGTVAALAVAAWGGARLASGADCPSEAEQLAAVWAQTPRAALEARLTQAKPEAAASVAKALGALEQRAAAWAKDSAGACAAATRRRASHVDIQRAACLTRRGQALRILVEAIAQADPAVVARSDELVDDYLRDSPCGDGAQLSRLHPDDVPEDKAPLALELRSKLLRARALDQLERGTDALELNRAVAITARGAGLAGFESEAVYRAGTIEYYQGDEAGAVRDYERSLRLALSAGMDERAFHAGVRLVRRLADKEARLGEAQQILGVTEALWERLGRDEREEADLNWARTAVLAAQGRHEEVARLDERSLEVEKRLHGPRSREASAAMVSLSSSLWELGRIEESNRLEEQAVALVMELRGPDFPGLTSRYVTLGMGLSHEGRRADAQAMLERGLALAQAQLDPADGTTFDLMLELSAVLEGVDEPRALALAEQAVAFYEKGTDEATLAGALTTRARALAATGKGREALADCRRARTLSAGQADPDRAQERTLAVCEAEAYEVQGNWPAARAAWQLAYEVRPPSRYPVSRGRVAFGLARAVRATGGDAARAEALGREALAHYATFKGFERERATVEAWLNGKGAGKLR